MALTDVLGGFTLGGPWLCSVLAVSIARGKGPPAEVEAELPTAA